MKRSPIRKVGKIGNINLDARRKIATQCYEMGLEYCELNFPGCMHNFGVAPAHRRPRIFYREDPDKLSDYKEWVVACQFCHERLDNRSKMTQKESDDVFKRLRGI